MNRRFQWHWPRFFPRRLGLALLKGFLLGLALGMILTGLRLFHTEDVRRFLDEYTGFFLAWRLLLYGLIAWGGWRVLRLQRSELRAAPELRQRWRRIAIAVLGTIALLEVSQLLQ
ncbi:MAG: hypothetical protein LBE85_12060 [Candidatus Accumulibacter sp.]|jgi:hypothetical protein|nr:hypothetical protein [Accumulibacter sp.]